MSIAISEEQIRESLSSMHLMWQELFPAEQERLFKAMVSEVIVHEDHLDLRIKIDGMLHAMQGTNAVECMRDKRSNHDGNMIASIKVPYNFKHNGSRKLISLISPPADPESLQPKRRPDKALLKALVKACHWQTLLDEGKFNTVSALSRKYNLNRSGIVHVLQLNLLSPRIKQAILDGIQPRTMNMEMLKKPFPDEWEAQERHFAFE